MRFLWPTASNQYPSAFTRFGRVLHWIAAILGLPLIALGGVQLFVGFVRYGEAVPGGSGAYTYTSYPGHDLVAYGAVSLIVGIVIYGFGRGLRYIFSGE